MGEKEKKKVNKAPGKVRGDIIAAVLILIIIAGYIFYECYDATHVDVETVTAVTSMVYETVEAKALVVRDEHIISGSSNGVTVASVGSGEKVGVGGNVAMVFSSEEDAKLYSAASDLQSQLDYYNEIESKAAGTATDVESLDRDILADVNSYIRTINSNSYDSLQDCSDDLNEKLTRRQMMIGKDVDFSQAKSDLQQQLGSIDINACKPTGYVTADESGIFSSYTDGFEAAVDYGSVTDLDAETLRGYIDSVNNTQTPQNSFGKLITSYEWYFCCVVSADDVKGISNGDSLNVALKAGDDAYSCQVVSGADTDLGAEETVLILRCSEMNSRITSMRLEDIEIRYNEYKGFKVPSSAIHADSEGNKFVYALISNKVARRDGNIIYSTKDYAVFEYDPESSNSIRFYDQIITKGTDLHDGKIYS